MNTHIHNVYFRASPTVVSLLMIFLCCPGPGIYAQPVSFFCTDTSTFNKPGLKEMTKWMEEADDMIWLNPLDAVHHFFSTEAVSFDWRAYPCMSIAYHLKMAEALKRLGAYDEADKAGLIAYDLDTLHGRRASQVILSTLASIAYESKDYARAAKYYALNYKIVKEEKDPVSRLGGLNNHALALLQLDSIEQARVIFRQAIQDYNEQIHEPRTLLASLYDNLAEVELRTRDTTNAIQLLLKKDSVLQLVAPDTLRMFETYARLAQLYLIKGIISPGMRMYTKATWMATNSNKVSSEKNYQLELHLFEYFLSSGNYSAAMDTWRKMQNLRLKSKEEQLAYEHQKADVLRSYANYSVAQERTLAKIQLEKKEQEQMFQRRLTYLSLVFGLILAFSVYMYFHFRTKANQQRIRSLELSADLTAVKIKNQELEKELLKNSLDDSERELVSTAMDNAKRKEWTKEVMNKMEEVLAQPAGDHTDGFRKLYLQLVHQFQIQDRLSLTQVHQDIPKTFLHKLKTRFPDLSPAEIELCVLIRLGLTGKEIAIIRNIDPESIRKARYRLRSKMKAADPEEFSAILNAL